MQSFKKALEAWVTSLTLAFAESDSPWDLVQVMPPRRQTWKPADGHWVREESVELHWTLRFINEMQASELFAVVESAAEADKTVSRHLGALVGTGLSRELIEIKQLAWAVLPALELAGDVPRIGSSPAFDEQWNALEDFLQAESFQETVFWPLAGVVLHNWPIDLGDGVELDRMSDAETNLALLNGAIPHYYGHLPFVSIEEPFQYCLRYRFALEKVIGDEEAFADSANALAAQQERLNAIGEDFAQAAALIGVGRFAVLGEIRDHTSYPSGTRTGSWSPIESRFLRGSPLDIGAAEAALLTRVWSCLGATAFRKRNLGLNLALRRFAQHGLRWQPDDQILDLMIAAEAIYLSNLGNETERGELRYRLALRSAYWSDPTVVGRSRASVFALMKSAYDARSALAHGSRLNESGLKVDGEKVSLEIFLTETRTVVREGLLKAVLATEHTQSWKVDWDAAILALLDKGAAG